MAHTYTLDKVKKNKVEEPWKIDVLHFENYIVSANISNRLKIQGLGLADTFFQT